MAVISTCTQGLLMIDVVIISNHPARDFGDLSKQKDMVIRKVLPTSVDNIVVQIGRKVPNIIIIADSIMATSRHKLCHFLSEQYVSSRVLVLTGQAPTFDMLARSGFHAKGYVMPEQQSKLAKAVRVVSDGEAWIPRRLVTEVVNRCTNYPMQHGGLSF